MASGSSRCLNVGPRFLGRGAMEENRVELREEDGGAEEVGRHGCGAQSRKERPTHVL